MGEAWPEFMKAEGLEPVKALYYPHGTRDFYPLMTKALAMNPDFFDIGFTSQSYASLIIKAAREMGFKGMLIAPTIYSVRELVEVAGKENCEGFVYCTLPSEGPLAPPKAVAYRKAYEAMFGKYDNFGLRLFDELTTLLYGMELADSLDTTEIRDALEAAPEVPVSTGKGVWCGEKFYGIKHLLAYSFFMGEVKGGEFVPLEKIYAPLP